jgi:hypothetical protein
MLLCHCEASAHTGCGALSAKREEMPLGCNPYFHPFFHETQVLKFPHPSSRWMGKFMFLEGISKFEKMLCIFET